MSIQAGRAICYGANPRLATMPIRNAPPDALTVRRRIRSTDVMRVYVRTPDAVTCYVAGPAGGTWAGATELELLHATGVNTRRNA